jgi:hypothetical protein
MSSRTAHRLSLFFGLAVLALTILGAVQPAPPVCGRLAQGYAPIIAFELARSVTDLHVIFGDTPGACRSAIAARMDYINTIDSWAYIPLYGAFLIFFFLGRRSANRTVALTAAAIMLVSCAADYVENYALFHISADPDSATWISLLINATETKWVGIGIAGALAIPLLWRGWLGYLALVLCGAGLAASLMSLVDSPAIGPNLSNAIALGWILFIAVDAIESFRPIQSAV